MTTIIMPDEIDQNFFVTMFAELEAHKGKKPIRLICSSNGGYSRPTVAIVDLLKQYPIVHGYILGAAISSGAFIWAACAKRYVYPNAYLGIHGVSWSGEAVMDARDLRSKADEFEAMDKLQCRTYAAASKRGFSWWYEKLVNAHGLYIIPADELVKLGMAEMVE